MDCHVGQDSTVNLNTSKAQALDKAVVGHSIEASCSVDSLDPQPTEITLVLTTVVVCVDQRVQDLLLCLTVKT